MKISQVALQLYTIRDQLKTPPEIAATLRKVREIGYEAVQVSGVGPIDDAELLKILCDEGLACAATHEPSATILNEPQKVVERLDRLNCHLTAYPSPNVPLDTEADVQALARALDAAGKVLYDAGKTLAYHNHHIEFRRVGGRTILEAIYDNTDERYLQGEPDTYWIQYGGGSVETWFKRLKSRMPICHLKDYAIDAERKIIFCEVGSGNLEWGKLINLADKAGCQWFAVEQDTCPGDSLDSARKSFEYIHDHLCEE